MSVNRSEYFSFYSHLFGAIAALVGCGILLYKSVGSIPHILVSTIYGLCSILLFTSSTLYHSRKKSENAINALRRLDHIAIFFMIAGTYTPICYIYLDGCWRWSVIGVQWLLVGLGLFFKIFYLRAPRWLNTMIYILMGWMALIPITQFLTTMSLTTLLLLFAGGAAYTIGAIIYAFKKPNPLPGIFGFHEIFHFFILAGAALHYAVVYRAITGT